MQQRQTELIRDFGLLKATALNMSNMVGIGPFITMHLILATMGGPQAMLGWIAGIVLAVSDGMIWSELSAAMPGSGGTYLYLRESFPRRAGRFMAFLFIWQFILSGPLEIASGAIGFSSYAGYIFKNLTWWQLKGIAVGIAGLAILLLYRRITAVGKLTVGLWIAMLFTVLFMIISGILHFKKELIFPFPAHAFDFNAKFLFGLGGAMQIAMYDYLGYYDVCYLGDEVRNPEKNIPRSILISVVTVAAIYMTMNLSIIGVIPWNQVSEKVAADFIELLYGPAAAIVFTVLILVTAFASIFALTLGYSRIPFAAARDGMFFSFFNHVHPTQRFPDRSLLVIGIITMITSLWDLSTVITAIFTCRILVQFLGQNVGLMRYRRSGKPLPFRMWLYPLPCWIAFAGWVFILLTSGWKFILGGCLVLALGVVAFFIWDSRRQQVTG
ncbi:MAG TPA: APC family permease [Acidobacteriota bacterium]|jgi:amino acid transporter